MVEMTVVSGTSSRRRAIPTLEASARRSVIDSSVAVIPDGSMSVNCNSSPKRTPAPQRPFPSPGRTQLVTLPGRTSQPCSARMAAAWATLKG